MKKILYLIIIFYPLSLSAIEKTKEEKVAKYIIENIQKDYVACYSFYKVAAESFKKAGILYKKINNYVFNKCDHITCDAEHVKKLIISDYKINKFEMVLVNNL